MANISILILSYKSQQLAYKCRAQVLKTVAAVDPHPKVLHWDNSKENENIHLLWNRFMGEYDSHYTCFLTADTYPTGDWLHWLVKTYQVWPEWRLGPLGAVGPSTDRCYNEQANRWPAGIGNAYYGADLPCFLPGVLLSGFCMLVNRKAWEAVGGFREDFEFYGGDIDFMYRIQMAGYQTAWCIPAFVHHEWGHSAKARGDDWYAKKRTKGNVQLQEAIEDYKQDPGCWKWGGQGCHKVEAQNEKAPREAEGGATD